MAKLSGEVMAICMSERRGTEKVAASEAELRVNHGIVGDAHAGDWHRQVSLISADRIAEFNSKGANVDYGAFGENMVVSEIDFRTLPVGTRFIVGDCELELTQIGKQCHTHCQIYRRMGDCIMPREGVFARVLKGGTVKVGDRMEAVLPKAAQPRAAVLVLSDRSWSGEREDMSGPEAERLLTEAGYVVEVRQVLPDDRAQIAEALIDLADRRQLDLIITSGGTGFAPRDVTPEATLEVIDRNAPGIAEAIRADSMRITGRAMLSRAVAGIRGATLIINLPGSPKAVREGLAYVLPHVGHGLELLAGRGDN